MWRTIWRQSCRHNQLDGKPGAFSSYARDRQNPVVLAKLATDIPVPALMTMADASSSFF